MRILLDTHVFLWLATTPERIGAALPALRDEDNELLLSAASTWEVAIKSATGRLSLPGPVDDWVTGAIPALGLTPIGIDVADTLAVATLPPLHRDPFDRMLVAQARRRNAPIITADDAVARYDVDVLRAG